MINTRLIAKNTVYLYIRLILIMLVTLYMSRVLLDRLGAVDYGLYYVVYGVIGLVSFLNGTLSTSTSRYITFELGSGDPIAIKRIFNTALVAHCILAGIILLLGETVGLWYVRHIMVVPKGRIDAAMMVYQFSILSAVISIIQVPFTSEVIAHEKMNAFAVIGIVEAFAKLGVVFLLSICRADKLVLYAALTVLVALLVLSWYIGFCIYNFKEVNFSFDFDKSSLKEIIGFSGWNVLANLSVTVMNYGVIMLFNLFFTPIIVAAQAIANQIYNAVSQFSSNIRSAVNPQIIKLYADEQFDESQRLTFMSAEYILYLTMLFCVPCILVMPKLLELWLIDVPEHTIPFARLMLVQLIIDNYNASFYAPMLAAKKISLNAIVALVLCVIQFLLLYFLFKYEFDAVWARYVGICGVICFGFFIKPYVLCRYIGYPWKIMLRTLGRGIAMMVLVCTVNVIFYQIIPQNTMRHSVILGLLSLISVALLSFATMGTSGRKRIVRVIKQNMK